MGGTVGVAAGASDPCGSPDDIPIGVGVGVVAGEAFGAILPPPVHAEKASNAARIRIVRETVFFIFSLLTIFCYECISF